MNRTDIWMLIEAQKANRSDLVSEDGISGRAKRLVSLLVAVGVGLSTVLMLLV